MAQKKVYDKEFKIQGVKLGREIGFSKAAKELRANIDTLYGWNKRAKDARLGAREPDTAMSLTEGVQKLRQQNKDLTKENARLKEENEFLRVFLILSISIFASEKEIFIFVHYFHVQF